MNLRRGVMILAIGLILLCGSSRAEEKTRPLALDAAQLVTQNGAVAGLEEAGIRLQYSNPKAWLRLNAPSEDGTWNLLGWKYLAAEVENLATDTQMRLNIFLKGKDKGEYVMGIALNPGEKRTLRVLLPHRAVYQLPEPVSRQILIDTERVEAIEFGLQWAFEREMPDLVNCLISNLRLEEEMGTENMYANDFFPFIDSYGQNIHAQWPEKVGSDEDILRARAAEEKELSAATRPGEWNEYGGWRNGPQLEATGHFRVEKYEGKWFFVDPTGRLFFSHGICVIRPRSNAIAVEDEKWFNFPVEKGTNYPAANLNLEIKYDRRDYEDDFRKDAHRRLQAWGINSIGNWGEDVLQVEAGRTPYAMQITDFDWSLPRITGGNLKFHDVFDPAYVKRMQTLVPDLAKNNPYLQKSLSDPYCIGYFIDNEVRFGQWFEEGWRKLVADVLKSPATQAAKLELVKDLKEKYGQIDELNAAWVSDYADWDDLLESTTVPAIANESRKDSEAFFRRLVEQYFRLCRDSIKGVAPHRLYLGSRFLSTELLVGESKKYCDVMTINIYGHTPANMPVHDMPTLVGEFHFGVIDRGLFRAGLCPGGVTQEDRVMSYMRFVQGALVHPDFVGAHWFQFRDQPLTRRGGDSENYPIGFVDVTDTPYAQMTRTARAIGENMYRYRMNGKFNNQMK